MAKEKDHYYGINSFWYREAMYPFKNYKKIPYLSPNYQLCDLAETIINKGHLDAYIEFCKVLSNYNVISNFNFVENKNSMMTFLELNNKNEYQALSQETVNRIFKDYLYLYGKRSCSIEYSISKNKINKDYLD